MTNEYYKISLGSSNKNFVNFIKLNYPDSELEEREDENLDYLAKRVAQNMLYFENNIETAKKDYLYLVAFLIKKGFLFSEFKDLDPDPDYPD